MTTSEMETIIRWDRETDTAILYSTDLVEARRWKKLGYDVQVCGLRAGRPTGWQATTPVQAIALLQVKAGQVKAPHWLEPPSLSDRAVKAQGLRVPGKADEIPKENRAEFSAPEGTVAS